MKKRLLGILSVIFKCCQGETISPFLFNLFLNDLEKAPSVGQFQGINIGDMNCKTLLYADDFALLSETREDLQVGLDILYDYCHRWKLHINTDKTCMIIFRKGRKVTQHGHQFFDDRRLYLLEKILSGPYIKQ